MRWTRRYDRWRTDCAEDDAAATQRTRSAQEQAARSTLVASTFVSMPSGRGAARSQHSVSTPIATSARPVATPTALA